MFPVTRSPGRRPTPPPNQTATIDLASNLDTDKLLLVISDTVTGEVFNFRFNVLPGDLTNNNVTSVADLGPLRGALGKFAGESGYDVFADINASGAASVADVGPLRSSLGVGLPVGEPSIAAAPVLAISAPAVERLSRPVFAPAGRKQSWNSSGSATLSNSDLGALALRVVDQQATHLSQTPRTILESKVWGDALFEADTIEYLPASSKVDRVPNSYAPPSRSAFVSHSTEETDQPSDAALVDEALEELAFDRDV